MSARVVQITDLTTWPEPYVRPSQLARYLGVAPRTVYYWIEKGALPTRKIGGLRLIPTRVARTYAADPPASSPPV
jgi:excisionase family DNA binding protein